MRIFPLIGLLLSLSAGSAAAATFTVNLLLDVPDALPGDGNCSYLEIPPPDVATCSLRAAIMEANATDAVDSILLGNGASYKLTIDGHNEDLGATGDLDIRKPVTISAGVFGRATINAAGIDRVIDVFSDDVTLYGLDITGGSLAGDDICDPSGGINATSAHNLDLLFLRVYGNNGQCGAAVRIYDGEASFNNTEIFSNAGTGISANSNSDIAFYSSSIHDNALVGIYAQNNSFVALTNSTVSESNVSNTGILLSSGTFLALTDSTVVGGLNAISAQSQNTVFIVNSIVVGNCVLAGGSGSPHISYSVFNTGGCTYAGPDDSNLRNKTVFISPLGYHGGFTMSHRPLTVSPAIDRAPKDTQGCISAQYDQRGKDRIVAFKGGEQKCDSGAVELESDVIYFDSLEWL